MSISRDKGRRKKLISLCSANIFTASIFIILSLTLVVELFDHISSPAIIAAFAQEQNNIDNTLTNSPTDNNNTITTFPLETILSSQPIYQETTRTVSENQINQTHMSITFSGNGTLTMPNSTETISTTSNGSALISFITQSAYGNEVIRTQAVGDETATATFYENIQVNPMTGEKEGIVVAVVHTESTSNMFTPLNGMIVTGIDNIQPNGKSLLTLWEWKSRVWNSDIGSMTEQESPMNTRHIGLR